MLGLVVRLFVGETELLITLVYVGAGLSLLLVMFVWLCDTDLVVVSGSSLVAVCGAVGSDLDRVWVWNTGGGLTVTGSSREAQTSQ